MGFIPSILRYWILTKHFVTSPISDCFNKLIYTEKYILNKLDSILNIISKNETSLEQLNNVLRDVYLGEQAYLIEDRIYFVDFIFNKFIFNGETWITDIEINQPERLKVAILNETLMDLLSIRVFDIMIQMINLDDVFRSINRL